MFVDARRQRALIRHCCPLYRRLKSAFAAASLVEGRRIADSVVDAFPSCLIQRSPASGALPPLGGRRSRPTSPPSGPTSAAPKPSVGVDHGWTVPGGSGWFWSRRLACDLEAIGPLWRCSSAHAALPPTPLCRSADDSAHRQPCGGPARQARYRDRHSSHRLRRLLGDVGQFLIGDANSLGQPDGRGASDPIESSSVRLRHAATAVIWVAFSGPRASTPGSTTLRSAMSALIAAVRPVVMWSRDAMLTRSAPRTPWSLRGRRGWASSNFTAGSPAA